MAEVLEMEKPRPQLLLPFAEKEWVSIDRAARILGVGNPTTIQRMAQSGLIHLIQIRHHSKQKVRYQSIVDFCDRLREKYAIPDRRPKLSAPFFRYRDEDLLPFPLRETMRASECLRIIGYASQTSIQHLCQEGAFEAYMLFPRTPWRIYRPSFEAYVRRVMAGVAGGPLAYKRYDER